MRDVAICALMALLLALAGCSSEGEGGVAPDAAPDGAVDAPDEAGTSDPGGEDLPESDATADPGGPDIAPDAEGDVTPTVGAGIFAEGCPPMTGATARVITVDARLEGPDAVGSAGDYLLMNDRVAVIVSGPNPAEQITYYHYGGIIADAVTVDAASCTQLSGDQLEEIGIILAGVDATDPIASTVRAFRGDSAEIIADGADGGPAILRVTGTDDRYWLVEHTLMNSALPEGKPLTEPFGVSVEVDYILDPGSSVVRTTIRVINQTPEPEQIIGASLMTFGDDLAVHRYAGNALDLGPLSLELGIPWVVGSDGTAAYAFAIAGGYLGHTNIGGIEILVDAQQDGLLTPNLEPAGAEGDTVEMTWLLGIGARGGTSATRELADHNPDPPPDVVYTSVPVSGAVVEMDGAPAPYAVILVDVETLSGEWGTVDSIYAAADGAFEGYAPLFDPPRPVRLRVLGEGRDNADPVDIDLSAALDLTLEARPAGSLSFDLVDGEGAPSPARLDLTRDDGWSTTRWVYGSGATPVPPGSYDVTLTRGYEFAPVSTAITVGDGASPLAATLERVVDTTGYMSLDTHVHAAPSPDSRVSQELRVLNAAAHGLEIPVATEHEIVASLNPAIEAQGLGHLINSVTGQEVTAVSPEHMTMVGVEPDGSPRGGFVKWYELSYGELNEAMYARGAGAVIFNHPGYLGRIGWDRVAGAPTVTDATLFGLPEGTPLWDWNFDAVEVQNGHGSPFAATGNGRFDDWMSFLNHGHAITAVGCSDVHGLNDTGFPRTYYASPTDEPSEMQVADVTGALAGGRAVVSNGAFLRVVANESATVGDTLAAPDGAVSLAIEVQALPGIDVTHLKVLANCDEVANIPATAPDAVVKLDTTIELTLAADAHLVVLAFGSEPMPAGLPGYNAATTPRAFTNALYVDVDGNGAFDAPGGKSCAYTLDASR